MFNNYHKILLCLILLILFFSSESSCAFDELTAIISESPLEGKNGIILFHADWCSRSREIEQFLISVQQSMSLSKTNEPIVFVKVNAISTKTIDILDKVSVSSFPSIFFYKSGQWQLYEYDVSSRSTFKYYIDLHFFERVMDVKTVEKYNKMKNQFQFILVNPTLQVETADDQNQFQHNKNTQNEQLRKEFVNLAKSNPLYTFIQTTEEVLSGKFFFYDNSFEIPNPSCSRVFLIRKYDKFDANTIICPSHANKETTSNHTNTTSQITSNNITDFFEKHQKPFRIYRFNQRVRKYLETHQYLAVGLFYRQKMHEDTYLHDSFYNCTRDLKEILTGKKEDRLNQIRGQEELIRKQVIILILNRDENKATKVLQSLLNQHSYKESPSVFGIQFDVTTRSIMKQQLKLKHQDFILFNDFTSFIGQALFQAFNPHKSNNLSNSIYNTPEQLNSNLLPSSISSIYPQFQALNPAYFKRSFTKQYLQQIQLSFIIHVILFITPYSSHSLAILPQFATAQEHITAQNKISSKVDSANKYRIFFSVLDVSNVEQSYYAFTPVIQTVPELRVYTSTKEFTQVEITNQLSTAIEKIIVEQQMNNQSSTKHTDL